MLSFICLQQPAKERLSNLVTVMEAHLTNANICIDDLRSMDCTGWSKLDLAQNLIDELPRAWKVNGKHIVGLPELTDLVLKDNELESISHKEMQFPKLLLLNLGGNKIRKIDIDAFSDLVLLQTLILHTNDLCDVPTAVFGLKNLTFLSLSKNNLTKLPKELALCQSLTHIYASENRITCVPDELIALRYLSLLDLRFNFIKHFPLVLAALPSLTSLFYEGNGPKSLVVGASVSTNTPNILKKLYGSSRWSIDSHYIMSLTTTGHGNCDTIIRTFLQADLSLASKSGRMKLPLELVINIFRNFFGRDFGNTF